MSIYISGDIIYAIKRNSNGRLELVTFPLMLECEPTDYDLRQHFNYSAFLGDQYASDLPYQSLNTPLSRNSFNATRSLRRIALAFRQTSDRVMSENEIVAISHRRGGWKTFTWNYNDDISFEVYSNFGYGSCSELLTRFFYKGCKLTPYSDYVKYRFANFSQLIHYTYNYRLEYSEWRKLMTDTLVFYNAVCDNLIKPALIAKHKVVFSSYQIFCNESTSVGHLLCTDFMGNVDGNAFVVANGYSVVRARGRCKIIANGQCQIHAYEHTEVEAYGRTRVYAHDSCIVKATGTSAIQAYDNSMIRAYGRSVVWASGECCIDASGESYVMSYSEVKCSLSENAIYRIQSLGKEEIEYASAEIKIKQITTM